MTLTQAKQNRRRRLIAATVAVLLACVAIPLCNSAWHRTSLREAYLPDLLTESHRNPHDGAVLALLGARLAEANDASAEPVLQHAIDAGENSEVLWQSLAGLRAYLGNKEAAIDTLRAGIEKHAGAAPLLQASLARVQDMPAGASDIDFGNAICPGFPQPLISAYNRGSFLNGPVTWWGRSHGERSGYETRRGWASEAPRDVDVQRLWGLALMTNRRPAEAARVLLRAAQAAPHRPDVLFAYAEALEQSNRTGPAGIEYLHSLRYRPAYVPALLGLGRCAGAAGLSCGRQAYLAAVKLAPISAEAWLGLAEADAATPKFKDECVAAYDQVRRLAPARSDFLMDYAQALANDDQYAAAEALIRQYIAQTPSDYAGHYQLGYVLRVSGAGSAGLSEAEAELKRALELAPHASFIERELGVALLAEGKPRAAVDSLSAAIGDDPMDFGAHRFLAQAYGRSGMAAAAARETARADRLSSMHQRISLLAASAKQRYADAGYHGQLAELYESAGQPELAANEHALAVQIGSDTPTFARHYQELLADVNTVLGADLDWPVYTAGGSSVSTAGTGSTDNGGFVDVTASSGIDYQWTIKSPRPLNILDTIGNGCALLDYNNDGNLDILLVGPRLALYQGDGHGHFKDVTHATGLDGIHGNFLGCAVGDYDNDGYEDIYLSAYRGGALLHNDHGGSFEDVTKAAGIGPQPWGTSCGFVDVDGDGRLDLLIANYVDFGPSSKQLCPLGSAMAACPPTFYPPLACALYRNVGNGRFVDVTDRWNVRRASGKGLGVAFADFDHSGHQTLAIANDDMPGNLLKNTNGRFADIAVTAGTAFSAVGGTVGGMGIDWGDFDNDGNLDLAVATFQGQPKCIYHNLGGVFAEQSAQLGIAVPTTPNVAFGMKWLDYDNDGWLDLMVSNGHVQDNVAAADASTSYRQSTQLFHNEGGTRFTNVSSGALLGAASRPIVGRGLAIGDFDNDGRIDALVVDSEGAPLLLHNETKNVGHWLEVNLVGTKSNRDGLGALLTVQAGARRLLRQCTTAGSYMSASDKRVHIGLGPAQTIDSVTVQWPSGHTDVYHNLAVDRIVTLREGGGR